MIESELGEGSCFTVVIPFRLDRQAKAQEKEEAADADITGLRILVAEDNELNMEIARFILEDCGALVEPYPMDLRRYINLKHPPRKLLMLFSWIL